MKRPPIFLMLILMLSFWTPAVLAEESAIKEIPVKELKDVSYGADEAQAMDVYYEEGVKDAPVIFMVHGGGWHRGDKVRAGVIKNKIARWVPRGFIFVSVNYRMPEGDVATQRDDIIRALAKAQALAPSWGGDASKFIIMGHSAGGHLVSLVGADPKKAYAKGVKPWLGTISLDSGALDVPKTMGMKHPKLFDNAFGADPKNWEALSPVHQVTAGTLPWLSVCSLRRADSCPHSVEYAEKAVLAGGKAKVLKEKLSHAEINKELGLPGMYTMQVEGFMTSLDPVVGKRLEAMDENELPRRKRFRDRF